MKEVRRWRRRLLQLALLVGLLSTTTTIHAQGMTDMKKGEGGSVVKGTAGPSGSQGAASDLERCDKPMATMAVVEPQSHVLAALSRYRLQSPSGLIRLMIQQSNCFLVVERGVGMQNMMQERALAESASSARVPTWAAARWSRLTTSSRPPSSSPRTMPGA
jgi:hypothetical protein